ncbi:hypothetical protein VTK56DRAFT_2385 [Thermocarpiscus australiensis]
MAAMATQQSAGALLNEKPLHTTLPLGMDGPNGDLGVNGHSSPIAALPESKSENAPNSSENTSAAVDLKSSQNQDAFTANQTLTGEAKDLDRSGDAKNGSDEEATIETTEEKTERAVATADTDMADAPVNPPPEGKTSEQIPPKTPTEPQSENRAEERPEEVHEPAVDTTDVPTVPAKSSASPRQPASGSASPSAKEDVAMTDAQEQAESPAAVNNAESAQETRVNDVPPVPTAGDSNNVPADSMGESVDAPPSAPAAPATAATGASETTQASRKISRERDIDSEDEPVAKRTKVEHGEDQVEVKTIPQQDRMDIDQQSGAGPASLYHENGEPKSLADESLDGNPITDWQNRQIRQVLAGVKKTKVGTNFRLPVEQLWPGLWNEYCARVANPIDISAMEKRLRGEGPPYATMGDFKRDLDLLVENSVTYNGEAHAVTHQARQCREAILGRMATHSAVEPAKPERKESTKQHTTRHTEPRAAAQPAPTTAAPRRPSKGAASSPPPKPVEESPAFAIPANNNGVPLIRRNSTKPDSRAKRPVKPTHPKDLVYDTKRKKKLPPELRFCDEVLTEIRKPRHYDINAPFMQPVDPVALNIPSYHKVIKKPMDLQTMANKMDAGEYTTAKEFEKDFDLIIKNCRTFNGEDHVVYKQALALQGLFRTEMAKKDDWMMKHAPASAGAQGAASSHLGDDSDDDEGESDVDEHDTERRQGEQRVATILKRLEEEQKKVNDLVNSGTAEIADVEIAQSVVAMLQKQLMQERAKLANLPAKKPGKSSKSKSKKAGGGAGVTGKKASVAGTGAGSGKKGGSKKAAPKRKVGQHEKEIIASKLGDLGSPHLDMAIDLIKKDTGQGENESGELELDIELLSDNAVAKLYDIVIKAFPELRIDKADAPPASDATASKSKPSKSKKNKPMSKVEQERRIQQLNELRAQAGRQGSGSQEPMESIEGNGTGSADPVIHTQHESEDEVSSEEE